MTTNSRRTPARPDMVYRFDGAAVWRTLAAEHQARIGALALELVAGWNVEERLIEDGDSLSPAVFRAAEAYDDVLLMDRLREAFVEAVPRETLEADDGGPRFPSATGAICRRCGCSGHDPCQPRCYWAEPDLCSACDDETDDGFNPHGCGPVPLERRDD